MTMRTAVAIAEGVRSGQIKARAVMEEVRTAVEAREPVLNAFCALDWPTAMAAADDIDRRAGQGEDPGPLAGVPFGVKDMHDCAGFPTSFGSLLFKGGPAKTKDEPGIARARNGGAIPFGKTTTSEFGLEIATRTKAWGVTRNPWNLDRTPGGSSGGSAAAVAAGVVPFAWGGDGGGSIRIPAAFTGTVGLKPNHGRVGRANGNDHQCQGVITTTVRDTARILDVIAGPADTDKNSLERPHARYEEAIESLEVRGLRAVWTQDLGGHVRCEPEVARIARSAAEALANAAGMTLVDDKIRLTDHPMRVYRGFTTLSAWSTAVRNGIWPDEARLSQLSDAARAYFEYGATRSARNYVDALTARARLESEFAAIFGMYDLVLSPTTPYEAFDADGPVPMVIDGREVSGDNDFMKAGLNNLNAWANVTYRPSISIPAGLSKNGLPIGLQLTARHHREDILLRLARILEQARPWRRTAPMSADARPSRSTV